jgi:hypothetical protein
MTNYNAADLLSKARHLGQYGDALIASGKVTPSSAVVTGDTMKMLRIPAGAEVAALLLAWSTFGTTAPADIGYTPVDANEGSLSAATTYFASAVALQTASANGTLFMGFDPVKFEQDVFLIFTFGTVSSGAAGTIRGNVLGRNIGVK